MCLQANNSAAPLGKARMEVIIQDGLPKGCYDFQFTLSNSARPDCCILMPDKRRLAIDAKFPLEAVTKPSRGKNATTSVQPRSVRYAQDINKHIADIAEKYLIPGETQDMALMFVPSESLYAELYDSFDDIIQKAFRSRVDHRFAVTADVGDSGHPANPRRTPACARPPTRSTTEVGLLMDDVSRLRDRVSNLGHALWTSQRRCRADRDFRRQDRETRHTYPATSNSTGRTAERRYFAGPGPTQAGSRRITL